MTHSKDELLAIHQPEALFPADALEAKRIYRSLSKIWHPDYPTGSTEVMAHITALYRLALERVAQSRWEGSGSIPIHETTRSYVVQTRAGAPFTYGHTLLCENSVIYLYDPAYKREYERMRHAFTLFKFASDKMRTECERYLPKIARTGLTTDGRSLIQLHKSPDLIRLRDVVTHSSKLDAKHVAWIVSSLLNLACYLSYANIVHHDISPDTYFISPETHSGALLGGWSTSQIEGSLVTQVPMRTYAVMPFDAKMTKKASVLTDLECIRLTARECLISSAPEPMKTWVHAVSTGTAVEQYREWKDILLHTFGPRRFVRLAITADDVYGQGKVTHG